MDQSISQLYADNPVTVLDGTELSEIVDNTGTSGGILESKKKAYYNSGRPLLWAAHMVKGAGVDPFLTVLSNQLPVATVISRLSAGFYIFTGVGNFPANKVIIGGHLLYAGNNDKAWIALYVSNVIAGYYCFRSYNTGDSFSLEFVDETFAPADYDEIVSGTDRFPIEVHVYQ